MLTYCHQKQCKVYLCILTSKAVSNIPMYLDIETVFHTFDTLKNYISITNEVKLWLIPYQNNVYFTKKLKVYVKFHKIINKLGYIST